MPARSYRERPAGRPGRRVRTQMIEWRWGLASPAPRDAAANNLAQALGFARPPNPTVRHSTVPPAVGLPCPAGDYVDCQDSSAPATAPG